MIACLFNDYHCELKVKLQASRMVLSFHEKTLVLSKRKEMLSIKEAKGQKEGQRFSFNQPIGLNYQNGISPMTLIVFDDPLLWRQYQRIIPEDYFELGNEQAELIVSRDLFAIRLQFENTSEGLRVIDRSPVSYLMINGKRCQSGILYPGDTLRFLILQLWRHEDYLFVNLIEKSSLKTFIPRLSRHLPDKLPVLADTSFRPWIKEEIISIEGMPFAQLRPIASSTAVSVSQFFMTAAAVISAFLTLAKNGYENVQAIQLAATLIFPGAMVFSALLWPLFHHFWEKRTYQKQAKRRNEAYIKELHKLEKRIELLKEKRLAARLARYPKGLDFTLLREEKRLFSRTSECQDFLFLALGYGKDESRIEVRFEKCTRPQEADLFLLQLQQSLCQRASQLDNALIEVDLKSASPVGIIAERGLKQDTMDALIAQLLLLHHPDSMRMAIFLSQNGNLQDCFRFLPHFMTLSMRHRMIFPDFHAAESIWKEMAQILEDRWLIIFYFDRGLYHRLPEFIAHHERLILIHVSDSIEGMEQNVKTIVDLISPAKLLMQGSEKKRPFVSYLFAMQSTKAIALLTKQRILFDQSAFQGKSFGIIECFNVRQIADLKVKQRWKNSVSDCLTAILGLDENGRPIKLDLYEGKDGPHGLIAGATGSGKSELLLTLILSLAMNYSPQEVQFVMVDYKGGSSIGPLFQRGERLPHLSASINNQDEGSLNRSLRLLKQECQIRQKAFLKAAQLKKIPITSLYQYQMAARKDRQLPLIAHLVVIVDEFAELKKEQPEFLKELISMARIGRSLGLHLLLATQKPSGVVDEQILSNISFRICLKVQTEQDSREVIGNPLAERLSESGQFYLWRNDRMIRGKAAYCHALYPHAPSCFERVDLTLQPVFELVEENPSLRPQIEELIPHLAQTALQTRLSAAPLWPPRPVESMQKELPEGGFGLALGWIDQLQKRRWIPLFFDTSKQSGGLIYTQHCERAVNFFQALISAVSLKKKNSVQLIVLSVSENFLNIPKQSQLWISSQDQERKGQLLQALGEVKKTSNTLRIAVIIEDLSSLFLDPSTALLWIRMMKEARSQNIYYFAAVSSLGQLRKSVLELFSFRVSLDRLSRSDQLTLFQECWQENSAFGMVQEEGLWEFVPCKALENWSEFLSEQRRVDLYTLPQRVYYRPYEYRHLPFGIDLQTGRQIETSGQGAVLITAQYPSPLRRFKDFFMQLERRPLLIENLNEFLAAHSSCFDLGGWLHEQKAVILVRISKFQGSRFKNLTDFDEIIWLGNGAKNQTLFPLRLESDLKEKEGIYFYEGKYRKFRCFDE